MDNDVTLGVEDDDYNKGKLTLFNSGGDVLQLG